MKHKKFIPFIASGIALVAYSFINGKGIFNKPRFAAQHDAVSRYIEGRHAGSAYSPIEPCSSGWCSVITTPDGERFMLYMARSDDGMFVFHETVAEKQK